MTIGDRIRAERERMGLTQEELGAKCGTTKQSIHKYESGTVTNIPLDRVERIACALEISPARLLGWDEVSYDTLKSTALEMAQTAAVSAFSAEARALAEDYDTLDLWGRRTLRAVADAELARVRGEEEERYTPAEKIIPLFGTAAAAGPGEPDTGEPWEDYAVRAESGAEFAVRISGDSMEPELHDGEIALCTKRRPEIGELVVVMVNGSLLCKQFITDSRNVFLRSLNRARADCDYDIWESGNDTVKCFGTVIHGPVPLADA